MIQENVRIEPSEGWPHKQLASDYREGRAIWRETSEEFFDQMLNCIPPKSIDPRKSWGGEPAFMVGEPYDHAAGDVVYCCCVKAGKRCFARYLPHKQARKAVDELCAALGKPWPMRCAVLWHFYDEAEKRHVTRWLPAVVLCEAKDGRRHVRTHCGKETDDAAPECVREFTHGSAWRFALTHVGRDGLRKLSTANQGRHFYDTREDADEHLAALLAQNSKDRLAEVFGPQVVGTFAIRSVECYVPGGDAVGIYFDDTPEPSDSRG